MKPCPSCGRRVQDAALKCHYCGAIVRAPRVENPTPAPTSPPAQPQVTRGARITGTLIIVLIVIGLTIWWLS